MNNQIRWVGLIFAGILFFWGFGATQAQTNPAPADFAPITKSQFTASFSWTEDDLDNTEFILEMSSDAGLNWSVRSENTDYDYQNEIVTDTLMDCDTEYRYRGAYYDHPNNTLSDYTNVLIVTTNPCAGLVAPSNLTLTGSSENSISFSWTDNEIDEAAYIIDIEDPTGWRIYDWVAANQTTYQGTMLPCNTTYSLRVRAYYFGHEELYSLPSNVLTASTDACPPPPNAPDNLQLLSVTQLTAQVTWADNSDNEDGFILERQIGDGSWYQFGFPPANQTSHSLTGLTCNTSYTFRMAATNEGGASAYSDHLSFTTNACANPIAPTDLTMTGNTETTVTLSWTDNELDESQYRLEYSSNGTSWSQIAVLSANTTSYIRSMAYCGTTGYFRVRAYRSLGNVYSAYSNILTASTVACTPPAAPTNLTVTGITAFSVSLAWTDNSTDETSFWVYRSSNGGSSWSFMGAATTNTYTHNSTLVNCNTLYQYRVLAVKSGATNASSQPSNVVETTTLSCPPAPAAPTNFAITSANGSNINFTWIDNADSETGFRIELSSNGGASWTVVGSPIINAVSLSVSPSTCDAVRLYRISAYRSNDNAQSGYSNTIEYTHIHCNPPAPTGLSSPGKTQTTIDLTWTDNSISETGYRIERSANSGTTWTEIAQLPANTTTYQDTGLTCGTSYRYRVRAHRSSNNLFSSYSTSTAITTNICDLVAPTNLRVTSIYLNAFAIAWNDTNSSESAYYVERSSNNGLSWSLVSLSNVPNLTQGIVNASCDNNILLRAYAYRSIDNSRSPYSEILIGATLPCAPEMLIQSPRTATSITVSWLDKAGNETEYQVRRYNGASYDLIAILSPNSTSYEDTNLNCETDYIYLVQAYRSTDNTISGASRTIKTGYCPLEAVTLTLISTGLTSADLSWADNNESESGHRLERSSDNGATWTFVQSVTYATSYTVTGLQCEKTYSFRVTTYRTADSASATSNNVTGTTTVCPPPPPAPSNLTATASGYRKVMLSWTDNATTEEDQVIQVSSDGGLTWTTVRNNVRANVVSYEVDLLSCSTSYSFRVYVYQNTPGYLVSDYSNIATTSTFNCPILNAPADFRISSPTAFTFTLRWTDNSTNEVGFTIQRSTNGGASYHHFWTVGPNYSSIYIEDLECNTIYMLRIRSFNNEAGMASDWTYLSASTAACPPAPNVPSNLTATASSQTRIIARWTDNSTDETGFMIEISLNGGVSFVTLDYVYPNQTSATNLYFTLNCGTSYYYRVYAINHNLVSAYSNVASATTLPCPPSAPSNFTATASGMTSIALSWQDTMSDETAFYLERSLDSGLNWESPIQLATNTTSYADTGLACGTQYTYRLRAYRSTDMVYSSYTSNQIATTNACPPAPTAPSNVARSIVSPTEILLTWDDNATNETNYRIERSTDLNGLIWTTIADLGANAESYSDTNIICGTNYRYRVMAYIAEYNVFSWDTMSSWVSPMCAPSLSLESSTNWSIGLSWNDLASATDYRIERSSNGGVSWQIVHETEFGETSYRDTSLACGTSYQYRVSAYNSFDDVYSNPSNVITGTTNPCTITEASCTLNQIDLSSHSGNTLGPVYMSADGSRLALNYQNSSVTTTGLYLYDIASETIINNFPLASSADINADGTRLVFISSANPLGQNADGNNEIFYWNNGTFTQLTNTSTANAVKTPQISDDGSLVVFAGDGDIVGDATAGFFLYAWDATNGIRKLIPQAGVGELALSGDGSTVVFTHNSSLSGLSGLGSRQLYRWNAADGVELLYTLQAPQSFHGFAWSLGINSDGSRIVFTDDNDPLGLNPDETQDIFLWDEEDGLRQLTESSTNFGFLGSMDGSGERILFFGGDDYDSDSTASSNIGTYLYDEGYGFSQLTSLPVGDTMTWGQSLSADGLRVAIAMAVGWDGVSDPWNKIEIFIGDCTPANHLPEPAGLAVVQNGENAELSWTDNALGENGYRLERSTDGGTSWEEIAQPAANISRYTDSIPLCHNGYAYRIRAYRSWDNHYSEYSNLANLSASVCEVLATPTNLSVSHATDGSISLSWTDNASDESEYRLERSLDGTSWEEIAQPAANSTSYNDSALECATAYQYRLRAYRSGDNQYSEYSAVVNTSTSACLPPSVPSLNYSATPAVTLSWSRISWATSYELQVSDNASFNTLLCSGTYHINAPQRSQTLCELPAGSYFWRVRAIATTGGAWSNVETFVIGEPD